MTALGRLREAMVRLRDEDKKIREVFISQNLIARGYVYLVEYRGEIYFLMNAYDFDEAVAWMTTNELRKAETNIYEIPVTEDNERLMKVMAGEWKWASQTK